jgi:DnaK suppressor protein
VAPDTKPVPVLSAASKLLPFSLPSACYLDLRPFSGDEVELERARALLRAERSRVEALLDQVMASGQGERSAANESDGDRSDRAEPLTAAEVDDAVALALRERLAALERAKRRLESGTFGRSVRSGLPIPDDRLEADPAAELTVEEAHETASRG